MSEETPNEYKNFLHHSSIFWGLCKTSKMQAKQFKLNPSWGHAVFCGRQFVCLYSVEKVNVFTMFAGAKGYITVA